ncbi:hypothetical protein SETIT_9G300600v2 [Setaria italica]|uniref:Knottins-like domain-containing protein n=1 Tax=Setaria italica TaxID=4555 RepID=A0A368SMD2_SETIT|nr:hypothetical protein SETIT_9G300600v2 [Setaria italica]
MEASSQRKKLSAAGVVLLLAMAAAAGLVEADECLSKSATFKGICIHSDSCHDVCLQESRSAYASGKCRGWYLTCWCISRRCWGLYALG